MVSTFSLSSFFIRFTCALALVLTTYNPSGYSYYHWILNHGDTSLPLLVLTGVILTIGWAIFLRATLRSLRPIGMVLAGALFGCFIWLAVDLNLISVTGELFIYFILIVCAAILGIGMSWSHIRRQLSGQADMDDVGD